MENSLITGIFLIIVVGFIIIYPLIIWIMTIRELKKEDFDIPEKIDEYFPEDLRLVSVLGQGRFQVFYQQGQIRRVKVYDASQRFFKIHLFLGDTECFISYKIGKYDQLNMSRKEYERKTQIGEL